jgi:hypothetical protein
MVRAIFRYEVQLDGTVKRPRVLRRPALVLRFLLRWVDGMLHVSSYM